MAQWAMAGGALLPFARATLIIHHTKPPPAHGTPILLPNLALLHTSSHDSYTGCGLMRAAGRAAALTARWWPGSSSKSAALASQLGRWMERKSPGRGGVLGPLRRPARSFCAC